MRTLLLALAAHTLCAQAPPAAAARPRMVSHISVIGIDGKGERTVWSGPRHFEAPNWSRDGQHLIVNSEGGLYTIPLAGGEPVRIDTGNVDRVNNDHGISPDGTLYAISAGQIFLVPSTGGAPRQVTSTSPSYWHGWSPDGKRLAYCAPRPPQGEARNFDIYDISIDGGEERRLTQHPGHDDGPDYTPNGKWIWFNSDRSGNGDLWRMPASGAREGDALAERITSDERNDWFPHPSPDGKWLVYLSYPPGTTGHPANLNAELRRLRLGKDGRPRGASQVVRTLFGGQGTINVNSWAPDSRRFAFVWYSPAAN